MLAKMLIAMRERGLLPPVPPEILDREPFYVDRCAMGRLGIIRMTDYGGMPKAVADGEWPWSIRGPPTRVIDELHGPETRVVDE